MALSEHEQRALAKIEESLRAEDPSLDKAARAPGTRFIDKRRLVIGLAVGLLGVVGLVIGVIVGSVVVGVVAFCAMFAGAVVALLAVQAGGPIKVPTRRRPPTPSKR